MKGLYSETESSNKEKIQIQIQMRYEKDGMKTFVSISWFIIQTSKCSFPSKKYVR